MTFEPVDDGNGLRITRRFDSDELRQPVMVQSFYHRVDPAPRWNIYQASYRAEGPGGPNFPVPDGTRIVATLDTPLNTRTSRPGQPFAMTVRSPLEFEGARIDGVVSHVNPDASGRHEVDMRVEFQSIHPRRGPSGAFDAILRSVRTSDGNEIRVDAEGGVKDAGGATDQRVQHGAIGAALGAVIGAIAGGGKGAGIGAVVGGAGGAILVDGRDQLDLQPGSEITMTAIAPRDRASRP